MKTLEEIAKKIHELEGKKDIYYSYSDDFNHWRRQENLRDNINKLVVLYNKTEMELNK